uniref:ABC transporter domain-containing protein n=1 Tax=Araucaria cunninghamii TaxID=56994 RepID=A0A0D6R7B9_ARACU
MLNSNENGFSEIIRARIVCASKILAIKFYNMTRGPPIPKLLVSRLHCIRRGQMVLHDINMTLHDGGAMILTGPNGSGKTTFLRVLAGFIKPSAGYLLWNGHDVTKSSIYELYKLELHWMGLKDAIKNKLSVLDNVEFWETLERKSGKSCKALEFMGLGHVMKEPAQVLSVGQRKRLQLARLLAIPRPIWLLDEPSVGLDREGVKLLEYIMAEHRRKGGIVFVATHIPIKLEDAMNIQFPPRTPKSKTLIDLM